MTTLELGCRIMLWSGRLQVMGMPFFLSQFTVFDWGNRRLGFASHASTAQ
jgi:hypothetical protein